MKRLTPLKAIRAYCLECTQSAKEVRICDPFILNHYKEDSWECSLYHFRFGKRGKKAKKTTCKAIRENCLYCCVGSHKEIQLCGGYCPLKEFRFGKNPALQMKP